MIPRVTEILSTFTKFHLVNPVVLKKAAERGSSVHAICAGIANGAWIPDSMIDAELLPYVQSFKQWKDANVKEFIIVEKRYESADQFTGQVDFVIRDKEDKLVLVDLKTSQQHQKTYPLQMGAYYHLLKEHGIKVEKALLVYLKREGTAASIHPIEDLLHEEKFFYHALNCYKYFNKGKK